MLDYLIKGGTVIDGTGAAGVVADVGVRDGRIVAVGTVSEPARETIDATGLVVCPGFVDPHTHYDAQLFWDPYATPSNVHGITSIVAGNCGFTLAPLDPTNAEYLLNMMVKVEGMPKAALEEGVPWSWRTFGDFLDCFEGRLGVNAGFLVGHTALRRHVMGAASVGNEASAAQLDAMKATAARKHRRRRPGFLDVARVHTLRRRRPAGAITMVDARRGVVAVRGRVATRRHHARARQRRLPQRVQR